MPAENTHILVVDDDRRLRALIGKFLKEEGYYVSTAEDVAMARERLETFIVDLIVLDVMMPGKTGIQMTEELRKENCHVPILMLTAMGEIDNRIAGLESGADDYLGKPFEPKELVLRIESILRRSRVGLPLISEEAKVISLGGLSFNPENGRLMDGDGNITVLTSTEIKLLQAMAERQGKVISRSDLAELLGADGDKPANERSVDVQITRLRQKIEPDPKKPLYLQTIRGEGYMLRGE